MYPRNGRLGQDEEYDVDVNEVAVDEPSWWERIWTPVEKVLKTGTEMFTQIAPYTLEPKGVQPVYYPGVSKLPTTGLVPYPTPQQRAAYPWLYPSLPQLPENRAYPTGSDPSSPYIILPGGQVVRRPAPAQPTNWAMPLMLGFGGIVLFTTMGKKRRK